MAGFEVQKTMFVSHRSVGEILDIPAFVGSIFNVGSVHGFEDSLIDRVWFLVLLVCLVPLWKMDRRLFFFAVAVGIPPAMTSFMAYTRYFMMAFPVFLVLGNFFGRERGRGAAWILLGILVSVQILFTVRHINFIWAG
jgi:hypothetical protein